MSEKVKITKTHNDNGETVYKCIYRLDADEIRTISEMTHEQREQFAKVVGAELSTKYYKLLDDELEKLLFNDIEI